MSDRTLLKRRWLIGRALLFVLIVMFSLMAAVLYIRDPSRDERQSELIALILVATFAAAIGFAEIIQRYRDDPGRLFAMAPTITYVCVNMAAAVGALELVRVFDVFGQATSPHHAVYEVLLAGFGSIAFLRSSLFTARVGDKDIDVGPATLLKSLLESCDRMINRSQASDRMSFVAFIMRQVDFSKAKVALPALCFTVVENVSQEEQERVAATITQIGAQAPGLDNRQRSVILGTALLRAVGPVVLAGAVTALGDSITSSASQTPGEGS